jgi:acetyltransferase-like isoleucine patch superfamily enzyme
MGTFPGILKRIYVHLRVYYTYYVIHRADLASYLRAKGAQIGKNCDFLGGISSFLSAEPYLIRIGDKVTVTQGVFFVTHDGATRVFRDLNPNWKSGTVKMGPIEIGDNVFIGVGSIILPNTKIGSNVVIGAGAVVSKDIPSNVVAVGVPARVIYSIEEYAQRSLDESITIPEEYIKDRQAYLTDYFWNQKHDE